MKKKTELQHLYTEEGEKLDQSSPPWNIYPRPQLKRDSFFPLNGKWSFRANGGANEKITVPFPPESLLSGINRSMGKRAELYYKKTFTLPEGFVKDRVLLHFGAVDQTAKITVNGKSAGEHTAGGYAPFEFDVTEQIRTGENTIEVYVTDDISDKAFPYGKQRFDRGGMWYTPVSGIWQTVWMESVPKSYIRSLRIETTAIYDEFKDKNAKNILSAPSAFMVSVKVAASEPADGLLTVSTPEGELNAPLKGGMAELKIDSPSLWSPENPYLYEFNITMGEDRIESYFALRTLDTKVVDGVPRLCLNGKPYFFHALLDQGYFSDGIFTPATPECYDRDVLTAKSLGFNTLRKHIKTEPEHFYYCCDKYGMIVFQDMINNGSYSFIFDTALPTVFMKSFPDTMLHRDKRTREMAIRSMVDTVNRLYNHPCICYWTIFNEGWGQFNSSAMYDRLKAIDSTRFIDTASGWFHPSRSDVESLHVYFKAVKLKPSYNPIVLSEFGGYSCKLPDHSFNLSNTYGYKYFDNTEDLENALIRLYERDVIPLIEHGLCGAVMTQLTDVEDETNCLITYDRRVIKVDKERMTELAKQLKI